MSEGFRTFDHTGDLGLEAWAETPERLFEVVAEALMAQIAQIEASERDVPRRVEVELEADDTGDLLVHWLNTALLEAELARAVWTRARVGRWSPRGLSATLEGPVLDVRRHTALREIKAVSHHALELQLEPPTCRCRVVLDL